jgi:hypothetical protein
MRQPCHLGHVVTGSEARDILRGRRRAAAARGAPRGTALVAAIALVALMLALATAALLMAKSDLELFRNLRDGIATYYRTRGAVVEAVAALSAGYDFDSLLVGPDGAPETGDDGTLTGSSTAPACVLRAADDEADPEPAAYRDGNRRARVAAGCTGARGSRSDVEIVVGRDLEPFVPAALYLERADIDIAAPVLLDGADHAPGDPPGAASGQGPPVPDAASPDLPAPLLLPALVTNGRGERSVLDPAAGIDSPAFSTRALALGPPLLDALPVGQLPALFTHTAADAEAGTPARGSGLLLVGGDLQVDAAVDFSGVVVVGGRLRIGTGGALSVRGFLWVRGEGRGPAIEARGPLTAVYSRNAVADADRVFALPRRAVPLAEREVF